MQKGHRNYSMFEKMLKKFIIFLCFLVPFHLKGQPPSNGDEKVIDRIIKALEIPLNEQKIKSDPNRYPAKIVLAPIIAFEPAINWGIGVGSKILFKFKNSGTDTRTSNMPIAALYTLNNQIILSSGYTIFFNHENWYLEGKLRFSKFPQSYYGVGNSTQESDEEIFTFTNYLIEPLLLRRVYKKLFIGGGIRYNIITGTELEEEGDLIVEQPSGFDGSRSAGLEVAVVWDNRDNVLNAGTGSFFEFKQGFYEKTVGGTHNFQFNQFDFRTYTRPWKSREDIIAFHLFGRFAWGDVPIAEMSLLGGEESARGYVEGRYRDLNTIATQLEYRWQVGERIGFVFFGEAGDVFNQTSDFTWSNIKYGIGTGIRFKIVKKENLNIRFDYGLGLGPQTVGNFYLGIAEAF